MNEGAPLLGLTIACKEHSKEGDDILASGSKSL